MSIWRLKWIINLTFWRGMGEHLLVPKAHQKICGHILTCRYTQRGRLTHTLSHTHKHTDKQSSMHAWTHTHTHITHTHIHTYLSPYAHTMHLTLTSTNTTFKLFSKLTPGRCDFSGLTIKYREQELIITQP